MAAPRALADVTTRDYFAYAEQGLRRHFGQIANRDIVGVADFSPASRSERLHLLDMRRGTQTSFLVAHGRGSDPDHSGWLKRFSNVDGSNCTSQGAYRTGNFYVGAHGKSMRLQGLDPTNYTAEQRAIVVHAAWYVSPQVAAEHGVIGRSEGCFAVSQSDLNEVLARMGPGRLLLANKF